jgi:serine/threonine protein kinase
LEGRISKNKKQPSAKVPKEKTFSAVLEAAFLVLEYCPYENLVGVANVLLKGSLSQFYLKMHIFKKIVRGVDFLHGTCQLAHRDIKFDNIFLNKHFLPVFGDFGFSVNS